MTVEEAYQKYVVQPKQEDKERYKRGEYTDDEIKKIAKGFRKGILGERDSFMMCMAVSDPLSGLLKFHGIENELVKFYISHDKCKHINTTGTIEHFAIKIGGMILDPTADQFIGMPKVYFGSKPKFYLYETNHKNN